MNPPTSDTTGASAFGMATFCPRTVPQIAGSMACSSAYKGTCGAEGMTIRVEKDGQALHSGVDATRWLNLAMVVVRTDATGCAGSATPDRAATRRTSKTRSTKPIPSCSCEIRSSERRSAQFAGEGIRHNR